MLGQRGCAELLLWIRFRLGIRFKAELRLRVLDYCAEILRHPCEIIAPNNSSQMISQGIGLKSHPKSSKNTGLYIKCVV